MSNLAGKAYGMNVITPMPPSRTWANRLIFVLARLLPKTLAGLLGLSLIHFARWFIVKRDQWPTLGQPAEELQYDYMFFCSNFNGTWDQYIDAFADGIPSGLDLFWYSSVKYPHSIPLSSFKSYIVHNQLDTQYYYNATPGAAQRDIKASLRVMAALRDLQAKHATQGPAEFAASYRKALASVQTSLGSTGLAPVASNATFEAEQRLQPFVQARWG